MAMTMSQKILAAHAGMDFVGPGQLIEAKLDLVMANDITAPVAIDELKNAGIDRVFDKSRVVFVLDHFAPNRDIRAAEQCAVVRAFSAEHGIEHFFDVGSMGIEHALLPERGLVAPGELVIGADSHTCTYGALGAFSTGVGSTDMAAGMARGVCWFRVPEAMRITLTGAPRRFVDGKDLILHIIGRISVEGALYRSMEFAGEGVSALSMDDRFTAANMAIEAGAKNGVFPVDEQTLQYVSGRVGRSFEVFEADPDARYESELEIDLSLLENTVAFPHLPDNTRTAREAEREGIRIDQAVIGSCTNGRISDLRAAAEILKGRRVAPGVRTLVIPATQAIYLQALREGLLEVFIEAGAAVSTPTCGPCLGGHMGVLAAGERCVATTNRNFVGRMGHKSSEVYLANPAVAAASAVAGHIISPDSL